MKAKKKSTLNFFSQDTLLYRDGDYGGDDEDEGDDPKSERKEMGEKRRQGRKQRKL